MGAPFKIGDKILNRSVTMFQVGEISAMGAEPAPWIKLNNCGWVADTGRFSKCLETGDVSEFEKMLDGTIVWLGAAVDTSPWPHKLPTDTK